MTGLRPARSDLWIGGRRDNLVRWGGLGPRRRGRSGGLFPPMGPILRMRTESEADGIGPWRGSGESESEAGLPERAMRARESGTAPSGMYSGTRSVAAPWYSGSSITAASPDRAPKLPLTRARRSS